MKDQPEIEVKPHESTEPKKFEWTSCGTSSVWYNDSLISTSSSSYIYGNYCVGNWNVYQPGCVIVGPHSPTIGEDPMSVAKDSTNKTLKEYLEEFQQECNLLDQLVLEQAAKHSKKYEHEFIEFKKALECEEQKADSPIYAIEFATAKVFLQYYANMALQKPLPQLKSEQVMQVSKYLAATITCELRHRNLRCKSFWSRAIYLWDLLDEWGINDQISRRDAGLAFLRSSADWDGFMIEQYLRLGAYIFGGRWEGSYGGWPWASVAWYASEWVSNAITKGEIPVILWEKMLNAAHNNGRWMNKLGMGNVMGVLNMGANASPAIITGIAKKALLIDNPNDFRRIIRKWTHCSLPGKKNELELPDPGVLVDTTTFRRSKRETFIKKIKEKEKELKEKSKAIVLDAPDKAPVELKEVEEAKKPSTHEQVDKKLTVKADFKKIEEMVILKSSSWKEMTSKKEDTDPNKYSTKDDGFTLAEEWTLMRPQTKEGGINEQVATG